MAGSVTIERRMGVRVCDISYPSPIPESFYFRRRCEGGGLWKAVFRVNTIVVVALENSFWDPIQLMHGT